jgi:hypothetical protein
VSFALKDEQIPDSIPLTSWEKQRKLELEAVVEDGLGKFLQTGQALAEIRNRRLYRVEFVSFEAYVLSRFHLHRSAIDGLIRASQTAETLLESGITLPSDTNPTSLRAISALPGDDSLKTVCWQLAERLSPARAPSQPLVSKLCRMVRTCLEDNGDESPRRSGRPRSSVPLERETPFLRPVQRLSSWAGFSAEIIVSHLGKDTEPLGLYTACGILANRCHEVQARLMAHFPELATTTNGLNHQS